MAKADTMVFDKRFKSRNYVFENLVIDSELAGKYGIHKSHIASFKTRCDKKIKQDTEITKYQSQIDQIEKDRQSVIDFAERRYDDHMKKLNQDLTWMVTHERGCYSTYNELDGSTSFMLQGSNGAGYRYAVIGRDGKVNILTDLIGTVEPSKKQLALYEEYGALRSIAPQSDKQYKKIQKRMKALHKKDPEFIEKYTVLKIQEKLNSYEKLIQKEAQKIKDQKIEEAILKARADVKDVSRKLETVKQKYTTYTDTLIKQRRYNFIKDNINEIAKFAEKLNLNVDRTANPCIVYTNNGVAKQISYKELAVAIMLLGAKKEVVNGKVITYVNREKANYFAELLEKDVFVKNNGQEQTNDSTLENPFEV